MIFKHVYGTPFETEAVTQSMILSTDPIPFGTITTSKGFSFTYEMSPEDIVYGLGENMRGINKRGYRYISNCTDIPHHHEDTVSMYAAHNFLIVDGRECFGLFLDYPSIMEFDVGYTRQNTLRITCSDANLYLYVITGENAYDITKQFRKIIGRSYIPPKFAFGFGQSRWGYKSADDIRQVVKNYRENQIPLDMVYLDIDYMEDFKDFTINEERFPDFPDFVQEMKDQHIQLVPIIDAGVKIEEGYDVYEEGVAKGYFCKKENGENFTAAVWPGYTHFPDVLNPEARAWFGDQYKTLISCGIRAFWNDMNEPAIFYTPEGMNSLKDFIPEYLKDVTKYGNFDLHAQVGQLSNSQKDYKRFYHQIGDEKIRHDKVHNLFGYNMTRAAGEAFERLLPEERVLMFSRSSYIGMHRYGGIWTGDNMSWWSHILLNLKMLPSLNMCGFLYIGADLGGFSGNTSRDLVLRWLALGIFTPLMRNHAAAGTRDQECYRFENSEDFAHVIGVRYRLMPYLYSEYMKAALNDDLYFRPLAFEYTEDPMAKQVEDQLLLGNEIMIAPVYTQNATGRYVYLPEEMLFVKFMADGTIKKEILPAGHHYVTVALNEVPLFIRKGKAIPVVQPAQFADQLDLSTMEMLGYENAVYDRYDDDGISRL